MFKAKNAAGAWCCRESKPIPPWVRAKEACEHYHLLGGSDEVGLAKERVRNHLGKSSAKVLNWLSVNEK